MGAACSKKAAPLPDAVETDFRLRKTADGRRLEIQSSANLASFSAQGLDDPLADNSEGNSLAAPSSPAPAKVVKQTDKSKSMKSGFASVEDDDEILDDSFSQYSASMSEHGREATTVEPTLKAMERSNEPAAPAETQVEVSDRLKRYEDEPKLDPNVLPTVDGPAWLMPPDVKREETVQTPSPYSLAELNRGDHKFQQPKLFDKNDFSAYTPGNGPLFNGPAPSVMSSAAKKRGLFFGKFGLLAILALSWAPNLLLYSRLRPDGSAQRFLRWSAALGSSSLTTFYVLNSKMEFRRMFWRGSVVSAQVICALLGMVCFAWQTVVILTFSWLSDNQGVFYFVGAMFVGATVVRTHEKRHEERTGIATVLANFLALEKDPLRMAELLGLPVVRTNEIQFANAAPIWARYRSDELTPWLNKFLTQVWPFYNKAVSELVREIVEPLMEAARPSVLKRLSFKELDFGENPFVIRNVAYVGTKSAGKAVSIDVDFAWAGKTNIVLAARTHIGADINIAVKDLEIYSKLRVQISPLVPLPSPLGGLLISMTERPMVEFQVELPTGLEMMYNLIDQWLQEFVVELLGDMFIQPERLVIPLSFNYDPIVMPDGEVKPFKWYDENVLQLRNTGVLRVTVVRAENVPRTDILSKSDPFVKMFTKKHGLQAQTTTMMNDEDPVWEETFYVPVDDVDLRHLKVIVYDHDSDPLSSDEKLGAAEVRIDKIKDATADGSETELWLDFPEQVKGNVAKPPMRLLLRSQYIAFGSDAARTMFSGLGLLTVHVIRGIKLQPMDSNGLSDPYVKVKVPKQTLMSVEAESGAKPNTKPVKAKSKKKNDENAAYTVYSSKVHYKTLNPEFNALFEFSPASEDSKVLIELYDVDSTFPLGTKNKFMGNLEVPISVVKEHGGSMEARFKVGNAKSGELDIVFHWQPYT